MRTTLFYSLTVLFIIALYGCSGTQTKTGSGFQKELEDAPCWVKKGCSCFSGEKKKLVCGVGSMGGTDNLTMCRNTATARGRTEIARTLDLGVKAMLKDYQKTMTGGTAYGKVADDEQWVLDVSKQVTDISLPGTRPEDTWISEEGTCFALVVLDTESFSSAIQGLKGLDEKVKKYIEENAEKAFKQLDEEVEKLGK
jgi:hypothetical protein